ncbi:hypothetical protein OF83DRAFT_439807 [Amylostereum chailletii]|nr:hypothetical protein OF83DRAFT_439807 [Amylostereum chailletii]
MPAQLSTCLMLPLHKSCTTATTTIMITFHASTELGIQVPTLFRLVLIATLWKHYQSLCTLRLDVLGHIRANSSRASGFPIGTSRRYRRTCPRFRIKEYRRS